MVYVLTENGTPIRKAHKAMDAWGADAVPGHPTDGAGVCVFDSGRTLEVREYGLDADVWRVWSGSGSVSHYYGTARQLRKAYGFFQRADRLEWTGWVTVYGG